MIKNIEELKNIQIVCKNQEQVKNCLNYLEQLGFDIDDFSAYYYDGYNIIFWEERDERFIISNKLKENLKIEFYNKKFIKTLQKFIKEKREKKEKVKDFEALEDGRITKINNWKSEKIIYCFKADCPVNKANQDNTEEAIKYGLVFATAEARDKAMFKSKIETKLKNIAERLNAGRKIDWKDLNQDKFCIYYGYEEEKLCLFNVYRRKNQGAIYCLDKNFLEVAKQEIGEDNLIKYFKE